MKPAIQRVFEILPHSLQKKDNPHFANDKWNGKWTHCSTSEFSERANTLSKSLIHHGIQKGDSVAIMAGNCVAWNICDFAIMQVGAYVVPIYPTMSAQDVAFILEDAAVKLIFVGDDILFQKVKSIATIEAFSLRYFENIPHWESLCSGAEDLQHINLDDYKNSIHTEDTFTIIYTSGTTGKPKGVMLTHANMVNNVHFSSVIYPENISSSVSFLPISHVFERMVIYMYFYLGTAVYYAESLDTLVADIQEIKPITFSTVPRLLEKIYNKIVEKGKSLTGIKKNLFFWALALANEFEFEGKSIWYKIQLNIARKLIFTKWHDALGGNIQVIICGGAALNPKLCRIFWAADLKIFEGYGLTETTPVITVNQPNKTRFGTVGVPLKGVTVKIADDGEILTKGHNIMKGYFRHDELSAEVIDSQGWFHTGDIGELSSDGYLRITDRKKEIFKTAGGKYIAPQVLENKYKESTLIEQIMVIGENRRFPAALIVPNFEVLEKWCQLHQITFTHKNEMLSHETIIQKYETEIQQLGQEFGKWEQVKKVILLPDEWTIDKGEITPKLSLKRKVIYQNNVKAIDDLYQEN